MLFSPLYTLEVTSLGLLLIANLAIQFYVTTRVFRDQGSWQLVVGITRGAFIFQHGWQRADELALRPVMALWSMLATALILVTGAVLAPVVVYGPFS